MAWIQIHQQLKDHRKVLAAADELDIEPAHMLGLLISFWLWAIDNAPDGSLAGISDRMIATNKTACERIRMDEKRQRHECADFSGRVPDRARL